MSHTDFDTAVWRSRYEAEREFRKRLQAEVNRYREALEKYGRHLSPCFWAAGPFIWQGEKPRCTCGYAAVGGDPE